MNTTRDSAFFKRRKFLMVLPLLVLPFMTMAFAALGGGSKAPVATVGLSKGLNTVLPDAQLKSKNEADKMSLYEQSLKDSAKMAGADLLAFHAANAMPGNVQADAAESAINARLAQIHAQVNAPAADAPIRSGVSSKPAAGNDPSLNADVVRLEKLMQSMKEPAGEDQEMQQLGSLMDKILAVQNPNLVRPAVVPAVLSDSVFRAVPAKVVGPVKVTQGSVIELRLLDSMTINGQLISAGHSVFGTAEFSNQRIALEIRNIRLGTSIIPVSLSTYDKRDGMPGINAPEALLSDAVGSGSVDAINSIGFSGFDLGTQIAGAGLGAAKGLLSKKIRRVKQKLDSGYPVLLRDNTRKLKK